MTDHRHGQLNVAVLDDYQQLAVDLPVWNALPERVRVQAFATPAADEDELVRRLEPFQVVVAMRERTAFPARVIERLPQLRLLASTGLRNASIDLEACKRQGVLVSGSRGARNGRTSTSETALALILALAKQIVPSHQALLEGRWQPRLASSVAGRVLGLAGLGNIGAQMAQLGRALGMEVIAWSPNLTADRAAEHGARAVSCDELFQQSDVLSLHLVLSERTAGLVSAARLAQMKREAVLINTSRAGLVQEEALLDALRERRIAGAGLDVFWQEPLPASHPLLKMENVVLTPHLGYATLENFTAFYAGVVENILAWIEGRPVLALQTS
ncbi:D-2-hydroxyacid dehydrogenase family protein [Ottowia thiooxydans]|uniref:D-2-hydroxyacid dehydrogenase family protein n=1 Tax=Ottowia thiooxydans TaxID=219182 RepID=UPI000425EBA9|nr:D-2-hydroxyacid dehydrogenase family protein [Ottowia thiooxydans]